MKRIAVVIGVLSGVLPPVTAQASDVRVCVDVQIRTHKEDEPEKEAAQKTPPRLCPRRCGRPSGVRIRFRRACFSSA